MSYTNRNVLNKWNSGLQEFLFRTNILNESEFERAEISMILNGYGSVSIRCGKNEDVCGSDSPIELLELQQFVMRTMLKAAYSNEGSKVKLTWNKDIRRYNLIEYDDDGNETCKDCYIELIGSDNVIELRISPNLMEMFRH